LTLYILILSPAFVHYFLKTDLLRSIAIPKSPSYNKIK